MPSTSDENQDDASEMIGCPVRAIALKQVLSQIQSIYAAYSPSMKAKHVESQA
jgi:hypothetical protein